MILEENTEIFGFFALKTINGENRLDHLWLEPRIIKKGLGSRVDRHAPIGEGELGPDAFGLILNDPRFDGLPGILETPKGDDGEEDRRNLATLRGLVRAPALAAAGA